jgi:HK97 family phage major capsid protein
MRHEKIETKSAAGADGENDEVKAALTELTTTTTAALEGFEKKFETLRQDVNREVARLRRPGFNAKGAEDTFDTKAFNKAIRAFAKNDDFSELKDMSVGSDPDGGYTVIPQFSKQIQDRMWDQSPVLGLCRQVELGSGGSFEEPRERSDMDAGWVGEKDPRPATASPGLALLDVPLNELEASPMITQRLLDDSEFDLGAWLTRKIGDKFGRTAAAAIINGNGVKKPRGFLSYPCTTDTDFVRADGSLQYVPTGNASGFASSNPADAIRDLYWSMRAVHRSKGNWLMASATANVIDKFKDGQGNYLWRESTTVGLPPTLLGRPVEFDENMPSVASGSFPLAFGNFGDGYIVIRRPGIKMLRDPYTQKPNVLFYAYQRLGGQVANFDAIKLLKVASS